MGLLLDLINISERINFLSIAPSFVESRIKLQKKSCPKAAQWGGMYRIRTCDLYRVKVAL